MNQKKTIAYVASLLLSLGGLYAQESPAAAGGDATGTGGSVSFSIGQVSYTTTTGTTGSVAQGVQQPYEISTIVGVKETLIQLEMTVYPNPVTDVLQLKVASQLPENLSFQLYDLHGQLLQDERLNNNSTAIKMEAFGSAPYLLKVTNNNTTVKSFKIIKH